MTKNPTVTASPAPRRASAPPFTSGPADPADHPPISVHAAASLLTRSAPEIWAPEGALRILIATPGPNFTDGVIEPGINAFGPRHERVFLRDAPSVRFITVGATRSGWEGLSLSALHLVGTEIGRQLRAGRAVHVTSIGEVRRDSLAMIGLYAATGETDFETLLSAFTPRPAALSVRTGELLRAHHVHADTRVQWA